MATAVIPVIRPILRPGAGVDLRRQLTGIIGKQSLMKELGLEWNYSVYVCLYQLYYRLEMICVTLVSAAQPFIWNGLDLE